MTDPTPTRDEAVRHSVADAINRARYHSPEPGLPERGVDEEDPRSQEYAFRLADAAMAAMLASAPAPASGGVDAVKVEPLKFVRPPNAETLIKAETILGDACIWTHHEANGAWFWKLGDFASGTEASKDDAHRMLVATYEQRIRSALSPAATPVSEAEGEVERIKHERDCLAQAIADAAHKAGITASGASLTGPMLLMLCDDLADCALAKPASSPAGGDVREALAFVGELEALAFSKQMSQRPLDYEQVQTIFKAVAFTRAALSTSAGRVGE